MNARARFVVLFGLAACAAPPPAREPAPHGRVCVRLLFEPPLAEPGVLSVAHEAGALEQFSTQRTGVELWLPPGPASLRLAVGGVVWERPLVVGAGGGEIVWHLPR